VRKKKYLYIVLVLFLSGCVNINNSPSNPRKDTKVNDNNTIVQSVEQNKATYDSSNIPQEPTFVTSSEQKEIEQLIFNYFNALNNKNFELAFSLLAHTETDFFDDFITTWENVDYVQIEDITPYLITPQGVFYCKENCNSTTSHFQIVIKVKDCGTNSSINGEFTYFPSVRKSQAGKWLIYGLGTSP